MNKTGIQKGWLVVLITLLTGGLIISFFHNETLNTRIRKQRFVIAEQSVLIDSLRIRSVSNLMPSVMSRIEDELKDNPNRTLSDETISMITSVSHTFRPYAYAERDSLSKKKLSPERGQLLLILIGLNLDTGSLHQIMNHVSFAGADLRDAVLRGADLSRINLSEADLSSAFLDSANLAGANLSYANLWGVHLNKANLNGANLRGADLRWAQLNEADMRACDLYETDLTSAQLKKADLRAAVMRYTNLNGTFLNEANLTGANMFRVTMKRAQLTATNLSETDLTIAILIESNLSGAILTDAYFKETNLTGVTLTNAYGIDTNWFTLLNEWNAPGAQEAKDKYEMVEEDINGRPQYRLKMREK